MGAGAPEVRGADQQPAPQSPSTWRDIELPPSITASTDVAEVLAGADLVVLAVPAQSLRLQLRDWKALLEPDAVVVSLMKGLELSTDARMSEVIREELAYPGRPHCRRLRTEPGHGNRPGGAHGLRGGLHGPRGGRLDRAGAAPHRTSAPTPHSDVVGVEIGGIVKNVIALAVGICEGKQMGDNTKASVITRGLAETTRLALALGGEAQTMAGLAGLGDLVATCSSPLSRNHTAGRLLGQGLTLDEVTEQMTQTAEGIKSGQAVHDLAGKLGVEMPITAAVVAVLAGKIVR